MELHLDIIKIDAAVSVGMAILIALGSFNRRTDSQKIHGKRETVLQIAARNNESYFLQHGPVNLNKNNTGRTLYDNLFEEYLMLSLKLEVIVSNRVPATFKVVRDLLIMIIVLSFCFVSGLIVLAGILSLLSKAPFFRDHVSSSVGQFDMNFWGLMVVAVLIMVISVYLIKKNPVRSPFKERYYDVMNSIGMGDDLEPSTWWRSRKREYNPYINSQNLRKYYYYYELFNTEVTSIEEGLLGGNGYI